MSPVIMKWKTIYMVPSTHTSICTIFSSTLLQNSLIQMCNVGNSVPDFPPLDVQLLANVLRASRTPNVAHKLAGCGSTLAVGTYSISSDSIKETLIDYSMCWHVTMH